MGYRVAKVCALETTTPITPYAYVVLNRMAWAVLDKAQNGTPAAEYWGGWEWLGLPFQDERTNEAVRHIVMRSLRELNAKGLIKPLGSAHRGQRQHYRILVDY